MLIAPFSLIETPVSARVARRRETHAVPHWLHAWAIGGMILLLLIPSLRGDNLTGLSLPFWLVAAPLINIVWISRTRWFTFIRTQLAQRPVRRRVRSSRTH